MNKESEIASTAWVGFALQHSEANRKSPSMSNPVMAYEPNCVITEDDFKVAYNIAYKMGVVDMDKIKANHPEYAAYVGWFVFWNALDLNQVARDCMCLLKPYDVYFNQQYEANGRQVINALVATIGHVAEELQKPCEVKIEYESKAKIFKRLIGILTITLLFGGVAIGLFMICADLGHGVIHTTDGLISLVLLFLLVVCVCAFGYSVITFVGGLYESIKLMIVTTKKFYIKCLDSLDKIS